MKVGDLVFEVPFGKEWFKKNPWLSRGLGIITEVVNHETVYVMWSGGEYQGQINMISIDYLEKMYEGW